MNYRICSSLVYNLYNVWYVIIYTYSILSNIYKVHLTFKLFSHPKEKSPPPSPEQKSQSVVEIHINHVHMILAMHGEKPKNALRNHGLRQKNRHQRGKKRLV